MGMVVRSNVMAVNSQRQLGMNNSQVSKALEKLSSGYRINRAGDDASGLAISEKMKAQIKGLDTASLNSQDGISLVQTAEGALTEVHNMLNRMTEIATRSANGINDDINRESLQKEVKELQTEIDRISKSTNFNGINLLDGSLGGGSTSAVTNVDTNLPTSTVKATAGNYTSAALSVTPGADGKVGFSVSLDNGKSYNVELTYTADKKFVDANGKEYGTGAAATATATEVQNAVLAALKDTGLSKDFDIELSTGAVKLTAKQEGTGAPKVTGFGESSTTAAGAVTNKTQNVTTVAATDAKKDIKTASVTAYDGTNAEDAVFTINGKKFVLAATGTDVSGLDKDVTVLIGTNLQDADPMSIIEKQTGLTVAENADGDGIVLSAGTGSTSGNGLILQIGDTADDFNQLVVNINDMSSKGIGVNGVDISTREGAASAIDTIRAAIDTVSEQRATLGATQNRLEYTINNLDTASENLQSANSRIRDTDMAKMMMEYTKMNVLTQSAQAMLAQANQQPQSVLQLLQ